MSETATPASGPEPRNAGGVEKRRSTRIVRAVPIIVVGTDALGQPFRESTSTMMVDCYGCKFQLRNYAPKHSTVAVEIFRAPGWDRRVIRGKVVWVQRPRTHRDNYQIAIEMEVPGNVWGLTPSPSDWFPRPEDQSSAPIEVSDPGSMSTGENAVSEEENNADRSADTTGAGNSPTPGDVDSMNLPSENAVIGTGEPATEPDEEFTFTREHLDGQVHEAIGRTVRAMIERASEAAVRDLLEDVSERAFAVVDAVRRISEEAAAEVDAKIRKVLDEAEQSLPIDLPIASRANRRRKGPRRNG